MKYSLRLSLIFIIMVYILVNQSCTPYVPIQIETVVPAEIDFPGNFNAIAFVNLATDASIDEIKDTTLFNVIAEEMNYGFKDAIKNSVGIDSSQLIFMNEHHIRKELYKSDTVSWNYLSEMAGDNNTDLFIILDSLHFSTNSSIFTELYYDTVLYYKNKELYVNAYWSVFDLIEKKTLDKFHYVDTLIWTSKAFSKERAESKVPNSERSIREGSYFAALDYAKRILPGWKVENRYYFHRGNEDFAAAARFVRSGNWEEACKLWKKYSLNDDKELATRACINMAFASELKGDLTLAIIWAEKAFEIRKRPKTLDYINRLRGRQIDLKKLSRQIYYYP